MKFEVKLEAEKLKPKSWAFVYQCQANSSVRFKRRSWSSTFQSSARQLNSGEQQMERKEAKVQRVSISPGFLVSALTCCHWYHSFHLYRNLMGITETFSICPFESLPASSVGLFCRCLLLWSLKVECLLDRCYWFCWLARLLLISTCRLGKTTATIELFLGFSVWWRKINGRREFVLLVSLTASL